MSRTLRTARQIALVDALVAYRVGHGMTQKELASRWGRAPSIVAALEGGGRRIDLVELVELSEVIGFDLHELVDRVVAAG